MTTYREQLEQENKHYIDLIKAAGWRVFVRPATSPRQNQYCYFTDGEVIGYAQWSDWRPKVSSVHKPNRQTGTGFAVAEEITPETLERAARCTWPAWAIEADRQSVHKYKDWDAFHNKDAFRKELIEV